jgi:hypothetical protein
MKVHVERLAGEPVVEHYLPADESFEGEGGEHVQPETETGDVYHGVVGWEVVEDVSLGEGTEGEEASEGHKEASYHGDGGAVVGYFGEAVDGGCFEGAVDEE